MEAGGGRTSGQKQLYPYQHCSGAVGEFIQGPLNKEEQKMEDEVNGGQEDEV